MVIVMPEDRRGLAVLEDFLYKTSNFSSTTNNYENLLDHVMNNIDLQRKRGGGKQSIDVEMPSFTISSDISVAKYMQAVMNH